jgi:dTDP-D-glucose 4,6-dehydratase
MPQAKAGVEMMYEFTKPFVVESGRIEGDLGLRPTPIETGLALTVNWYAQRAAN